MTLRTHPCAATGCQHQVPGRMLMCMDHWRMVPVAIRREVRQALVEGKGYRGAVAQAVAAVQEKQERKAAAHAGPSGSLFT